MPKLVFKVSSDYQEVIRLRQECEKLEAQLKKMDVNKSPAAAKALEMQLASARQQMMGLVTEAAKAGAVMENDLKKKLNSASKASDELTEEIIKQRKIIRDTQDDVRRLSNEYLKMGKYSPNSKAKLAELNTAKAALNEQRYSLGELQDQQARNRLEVRKLTREYKEFASGTNNADAIVKSLTDSLKRTAAEIGGLMAIKQFGLDVIDATGRMQQLQVALSTILQDKSKADHLIGEIVQFAAKTPFNLDDVANGAKQLLAYGSTADKVVGELSMLGDVASGLQIPIGQLIYLYGTLRTQGRAMTVDIRQFAGRGIPIYEELAKVLGVSKDQVGELVKEGKVGFKEVEQAFKNMTSEGGKFANLMENSAGTWPQRLSNIQDTLFQKMNDFGNKYKDVFEFGIGTTEDLVESLDDVLSVIGGLIAAYGTYKAALITAAVAQKAVGFLESIRLIAMYRKELGLATAAQQAFNVAAKSNVYVALLSVLIGVGTAVYMFTKRTNEAAVAQEALNSVNKKADEEFSKQAANIDRLNGVLKSETSSINQKKKALSDLQSIIPSYNASLNEEGKLINNNTEAIKAYLTQLEKQIRMKAAQEELEELYRKKRTQEKQQKEATANYNEMKSLYNSSVTMTNSSLQNRGISTGVAVFSQNSTVNNQLKDNANKAKRELDSVNKKLGETLSSINAIEKEIEQSSLSEKKDVSQSTISKEVEDTTNRIKVLKQEISDLRGGRLQAEAGKTVESAISAKEKELQNAQKTLETLTGVKQKDESSKALVSQQKLSDELLQLHRTNQQDEINLLKEGSEKKRRQIELDYQKEIDAYNKAKAKYGETDEVKQMKTNAENKHKQSLYSVDLEQLQSEKKALNSYLQEYGTFQQRKYAIAQEYADRIAKAQSDAEKALLGKERDSKLAGMETEALKKNIDWVTVFGEFGGMFSDIIRPVLEDAKRYMLTDGFKTSDASSQQAIVDAVNQMEKSLGGAEGLNFKKLGEDIQTYQNAVVSLNLAKEQEAEALERLAKAQEDYKNALENGTEEQKNAAKEALTNARNNADLASANVQMQTENAEKVHQGMSDTATRLKTNMDNVTQGLQKLASGGLSSIYDGLIQAGKGIGGAASKVSKKLEEVPVVGWIVSIIDVFKDGLSNVVGGLLDAVFNAVSGIIDDVFSGDLFVTIGESLLTGVGKILDAITFGGFSSWLGSGESDEHLKEDVERLTQSNQDLKIALDNLAEKMEDSAVADAPELYEQQKKNIQQSMANTQEMMRRSGAAYSNGFLGMGGTHSSNKRVNDAMSSTDWERISKVAGTTVRDVGDFWNLTSEQMYNVLMGAGDLYSKIKSYADDGHENAAQYMDEYISYWKQLEELEEAYYEKLTSISFDTVRDDFKSILLDMESDTKDFAESFEKMMQEAIIESMISDTYAKKLKDWYKNFADSMEDDGSISKDEQNSLKQQWDEMVNAALAERDMLIDSMGWDTSSKKQSATSKGYATASQDSIDELSGRTTAMYESNLRIEAAEQQQTIAITELRGSITALISQNSSLYNIADETRTILANSYLELQQIRENTGEIIKPIKKMQADIAEVKQNTSRL